MWGCEAAALAARRYIKDYRHRRVLLKIDMHNTFNSLKRSPFLSVARVWTTGLCSLLRRAYSSQTRSFFGEEEFASETGIQQGAFFALSVDEAARGVQSEFNVCYFDDATLGEYPERVHDDLVVLLKKIRAIVLEVNGSKCKLCKKAMRSVFSQPVGRGFRANSHQTRYFHSVRSTRRLVFAASVSASGASF